MHTAVAISMFDDQLNGCWGVSLSVVVYMCSTNILIEFLSSCFQQTSSSALYQPRGSSGDEHKEKIKVIKRADLSSVLRNRGR